MPAAATRKLRSGEAFDRGKEGDALWHRRGELIRLSPAAVTLRREVPLRARARLGCARSNLETCAGAIRYRLAVQHS